MGKRKKSADAKQPQRSPAKEPKTDPQNEASSAKKSGSEPKKTESLNKKSSKSSRKNRQDGFRETVESVVIAFVLAFLFRTFEAEAFVIPTGSMAETLYGRHKDVSCEKCDTLFRVSASSEINENGYLIANPYDPSTPPHLVNFAICPNCRFPCNVLENLAFVGDRILVNKFPYEFGDPERFDVVVFKYPEEPKTNYIKRLVGLPNETIKIQWGDLFARKTDFDEWEILRKPPAKLEDLRILVYDNDQPARELLDAGWPERWAPVEINDGKWSEAENSWTPDPEQRSFAVKPADGDDQLQWVRYRHVVPYVKDWETVVRGETPQDAIPQLITDFSSYNSGIPLETARMSIDEGNLFPEPKPIDTWGVHWVGDLTLSCEVEVRESQGELLLELVEGASWYRCRIDLATGVARLEEVNINFNEKAHPLAGTEDAETPLGKPGRYEIQFANLDDQLLLWIDGELIDFGEGQGKYKGPVINREPTWRDMAPAGIAARGADVSVSHLKLYRDIYYLSGADKSGSDFQHPERIDDLKTFLGDPEKAWAGLAYSEGYEDLKESTFELGENEFFVLGDNSARSKDSRLWTSQYRVRSDYHYPPQVEERRPHAVPRDLLIGKAFFIYWPHGIPFLNNGKGFPITYYKRPVAVRGSSSGGGRGDKVRFENSDQPSLVVPFYPQWRRWKRIY